MALAVFHQFGEAFAADKFRKDMKQSADSALINQIHGSNHLILVLRSTT